MDFGVDDSIAIGDDLGLMLARLGTVTRLRVADELAPLGMTMRQFAVLRALAAREGLSQAALGEQLRIDASSIVLVIDDCQRAGWAERRRDPSDRRRYALFMTSAGRRQLMKAQEAAARAEEELFAPLSSEQKEQLKELLLRLAHSGQVVSTPSAASSRRSAAG